MWIVISCQNSKYEAGERLYTNLCANCHMDKGDGLGALIPPISDSDYYIENLKNLPCIIKHGLNDTILVNGVTYTDKMEGIKGMDEIRITNLINFMNDKWYPDLEVTSLNSVKSSLENCAK